MIDSAFVEAAVRNPAVLTTVAALLFAYIINTILNRLGKLSLPVADPAEAGDFGPSIAKARVKYPNTPFVLPSSPPQVIVPTSMVNEWKNLPDTELSFHKRLYIELQGRYTDIGKSADSEEIVAAVKVDLTRNIAKTLADLQEEVVYAVDSEIGICESWCGVNANRKLQRIVALVSGRVFVGLPLCRDEEWIKTTINYTIDVANSNLALQKYHYLLRPFVAPFLPEIRHLLGYKKHAGKMLAPTMAALLDGVKRKAKSDNTESPFRDDQFNMASWILGHYENLDKVNPERMGKDQMLVSFAAIHTTTMTVSQALFDLATYPDYINELRAEMMEISATEPDGKLRKTSMPKLRKLDSFIKESQRMHPLGAASMLRIVTNPKGITLPGGHHLPFNTHVSIAPAMLSGTIDPSVSTILASDSQPLLTEFHPFRYSNLREIPGEENRHQFVTTGADSVLFGHGQWACPGRFFASNEIKVILIEILKRYDLALGSQGKGVKDGLERPKTFCFNTSYIPDPTAEIYFKARTR